MFILIKRALFKGSSLKKKISTHFTFCVFFDRYKAQKNNK